MTQPPAPENVYENRGMGVPGPSGPPVEHAETGDQHGRDGRATCLAGRQAHGQVLGTPNGDARATGNAGFHTRSQGQTPGADNGRSVRQFLAENGWAAMAAAVATIAVEMGVFAAGLAWRMPRLHAALAALAVCVLWTALAAPVLGAFGRTAMGALLRGGIVADASLAGLLVLWAACDEMTFPAALKIYCILAAMALAGIAATRLARTPAGRCACAVLASAVLLAALASPFWIGGAIHGQTRATAEGAAAAAVYANPFYAATACLTETARLIWHQAPVMYRFTRIGDYAAAPPLLWYPAVVIYLSAAGAMAILAALRRFIRPPTGNAAPVPKRR